MTTVQVSYAPNRELYDVVGKILDLEHNRPEGLIVHAANEMPDGRVQIVDVYESLEAMTAFAEQRIMPAFAQAGVPEGVIMANRPTPYEAFELVR